MHTFGSKKDTIYNIYVAYINYIIYTIYPTLLLVAVCATFVLEEVCTPRRLVVVAVVAFG